MSGPLAGIRVVEFAGLGPTPFAAMLLADMGAEVLRIERPNAKPLIPQEVDLLNRGRGFAALDLKSAEGLAQARELLTHADALIEGARPGVMERLGLGPDAVAGINPRLVYGRMTGWGQDGPLATSAGHDITYIAITGALHAIGGAGAPVPPLNLLGDFGGGAMYLAFGMVCALLEARGSGQGQVVDAAITDGTAHLTTMIYSMLQSGLWSDRRASNLLDGSAPFYTSYECACGGHMAVGALEPQFYAELLARLGLGDADLPPQHDRAGWPHLRARLAEVFATKTRDEWAALLEGTDACAAPVLSLAEARHHPHNAARGSFPAPGGVWQPQAAPRLSRTPGGARPGEEREAQDIAAVLARWARPVRP
ncbi:CoA transferase [Maritimibacter sp. 55A14]|uniref:CaiB/BaiF CoA transferase family protein n=1 Tax=Maritimibacter sp. 55A14 TaxID=2174844 RepID=UPI000D621C1C|nr:CaiB/BaiF CoA-transferase family protein [Maritimibacter sp. 55A14]PWE33595.1 CoA transferase [Maritimibacter sp. 55A14]